MTPEEFEILFQRTGLDPADHDLAELRGAYLRLKVLLKRLDPEGPAAEALAVFDPGKSL